jgi:hypothetical protein
MTLNDHTPVIDHLVGATGRVAVRLTSARIRVRGTDGERAIVRTADGRPLPDRIVVETTESGLSIKEREGFGILGVGRKTASLEIDCPRHADVTIESASGDIDGAGLRGDLRVKTVSGDIDLDDVAGDLDLGVVSGDAKIGLVGETDLAIRSVSGDVDVRGGSLTALRIGTTSGDIRIDSPLRSASENAIETLSGDVTLGVEPGPGLQVEARTVSGDIHSDLPHRNDGRMGRRSIVIGRGAVELTFKSVSGDLRLVEAGTRRTGLGRPAVPAMPVAPEPPRSPAPPPTPPSAGVADRGADAAETGPREAPGSEPDGAERMAILRALEAGELDVATAMTRLAALDEAETPTTVTAEAGERSDG